MKKFLSFVLLICLITLSLPSSALESGVSSFGVETIKHDQKDRFININITAPETVEGSKMFVAFYLNGRLTKITPLDIAAKKEFSSVKVNVYEILTDENGGKYQSDCTPDEIKVFTWGKNNIVPKTLCDNVLTKEVITEANKDVKTLMENALKATDFIRKNHLKYEDDALLEGVPWQDEKLFEVMDHIDNCAKYALGEIDKKLMTSIYVRTKYKDEIDAMRDLFSQVPHNRQMEIENLISDPTKFGNDTYYEVFEDALIFLDFTLSAATSATYSEAMALANN